MKAKLRRIGRLLGRTLDLVLGVLGGVVWAFVGCIVALHLYAGLRYSPAYLLAVCLFLPVCFGLCGLLKPTYFSLFSGPVLSLFLGDGPQDDDKRWVEFFTPFALFAALLSLIVGMLFQIHTATGFGVALFIAYAVLAPRVFRDGIAEPGAAPNGGPATPVDKWSAPEGPPSVS